MNPNPKSAKIKFAFTGTNSSGKTTMAMKVCALLKEEHHQLAELVSSQDRKITWKDDHFPVNPVAHVGMITNLIHAEVQATLKGDADIIITDRSVLDLYAIAVTDHPDSQLIRDLGVTVDAWVKTYTKIYYLPPLPYQEDGKRPPDAFRMRTHASLIDLISTKGCTYANVAKLPREDVYSNLLTKLGLKEKRSIFAEAVKWQAVADAHQVTLLVKKGRPGSDVDVWFSIKIGEYECPEALEYTRLRVLDFIRLVFGDQLTFDLMFCPNVETVSNIEFEHIMYLPKRAL